MKSALPDEVLMADCPPEWIKILKYIRTLVYESRPDYKKIFDIMMESVARLKITFDDPYDWEKHNGAMVSIDKLQFLCFLSLPNLYS